MALAVAGAVLGVVGVSRITGILGPYLARWTWVVAALVWLSLVWSLWSLLSRASITRALVAAALVALIGVTASTVWAAASVAAGPPVLRHDRSARPIDGSPPRA